MARSSSRKLLDELPSAEEMAAILSDLKLQDDATVAMMSAAYLDHGLELLLKSHFRQLTSAEDKRMFDGSQNGILGTFSAKIRVAYACELMAEEAYNDLLLINDIRNAFAHSLHKGVSFTHKHIAADCEKLNYLKSWAQLLRGKLPDMPPSTLFVETVLDIYNSFRRTSDNKALMRKAMRRLYESAAPAKPAAPAPSQRKRRRRSRHSPG